MWLLPELDPDLGMVKWEWKSVVELVRDLKLCDIYGGRVLLIFVVSDEIKKGSGCHGERKTCVGGTKTLLRACMATIGR